MCPPSSDAERPRGLPPASSASSCESHERASWCCERRRHAPAPYKGTREIRSYRKSCASRQPTTEPADQRPADGPALLEASLGLAPPRPAFDRNEAPDG